VFLGPTGLPRGGWNKKPRGGKGPEDQKQKKHTWGDSRRKNDRPLNLQKLRQRAMMQKEGLRTPDVRKTREESTGQGGFREQYHTGKPGGPDLKKGKKE